MYFAKKVNKRSRKAMVDFLTGHFRYNTMNSWNGSTSYAHCIKLNHLGLTRQQDDVAYALLQVDETFEQLNALMHEFAYDHDYVWQMGFNGRSSGYVVLYEGFKDYTNAVTAQCDVCCRRTYHTAPTPCTTTGCPGMLRVLNKPQPKIGSWPGRSIDQNESFETWDLCAIKARVDIVCDFDRTVDRMRSRFIYLCDTYNVATREILVPKEYKVLVRKGTA